MIRRFLLHLKLEAWRVWPWLAIWGGLLLLRGARFYFGWHDEQPENFYPALETWYLDLPTLMMVVVPFLVMKLDDPGDPNAFWTTRPRSLVQLAVVKVGLIVLAVVGGWILLVTYKQWVIGFPQGWVWTVVSEFSRVALIAGSGAAVAWARRGWIAPVVLAVVVIGFWHWFEGSQPVVVTRALVLIWLVGIVLAIVSVARSRGDIGYWRIALFLGAAGVMSSKLDAVGALGFFRERGFEEIRSVESMAGERDGERITRIANPLGDTPAIAVMDFGSRSSVAASDRVDPSRMTWYWDGNLMRAPGSRPLRCRFFSIQPAGVLGIEGGVVDLPGSRTVVGKVKRTVNISTGRVRFSVSGQTSTLVGLGRRKLPTRGRLQNYRLGNPSRGTASLAELVEHGVLELRHRTSGERVRLGAELKEFRSSRLEGGVYAKWSVSGAAEFDSGKDEEAWLADCELVINKSVPVKVELPNGLKFLRELK